MDNVGIVVEDLKAAIVFFVELGLELEGETTVEGQWVDRVVGLNGVRSDIVMMRTPDGHSRLELSKFQKPTCGYGRRTRCATLLRRCTMRVSSRLRRPPRSLGTALLCG